MRTRLTRPKKRHIPRSQGNGGSQHGFGRAHGLRRRQRDVDPSGGIALEIRSPSTAFFLYFRVLRESPALSGSSEKIVKVSKVSHFIFRRAVPGFFAILVLAGSAAVIACAQNQNPSSAANPFWGSVTAQPVNDAVLKLSLDDAVVAA